LYYACFHFTFYRNLVSFRPRADPLCVYPFPPWQSPSVLLPHLPPAQGSQMSNLLFLGFIDLLQPCGFFFYSFCASLVFFFLFYLATQSPPSSSSPPYFPTPLPVLGLALPAGCLRFSFLCCLHCFFRCPMTFSVLEVSSAPSFH